MELSEDELSLLHAILNWVEEQNGWDKEQDEITALDQKIKEELLKLKH